MKNLESLGVRALLFLVVLLAGLAGAVAQESATEERSALAPAMEARELNTSQQARMKLLSAERLQKSAEKYDQKAQAESSEKKKEKLRGKAKEAFEAAIRDYMAALKLDDSLDEAYTGLGQLFAKAGQHQQSLQMFSTALEKNPESSDAVIGRARIELATFKVEEAKASYDALAKMDPEKADLFVGEMRSWLDFQKERLGPEMAGAIEELDRWISEHEGS